MSFADLSLFPATPEQVLESRIRSAVEWAKSLSLQDYIQRDVIMDKYEHAADGKLITWYAVANTHKTVPTTANLLPRRVLAPRNDSTTIDFMCSCET